jgi:RHS repeat-associated protein
VVLNLSLPSIPVVGPAYGVTHRYLQGSVVDQVFADETSTGAILWALADLNSSVRDVAVQNVATDVTSIPVANHRTFDAFGNSASPITDGFAFGYTGREYDSDAGLQYNRARWYDHSVGRFVGRPKSQTKINSN